MSRIDVDAIMRTEARERERLVLLIRRHRGNISAIARAVRFSRQAISRHLERYGLLGEAEGARLTSGVPGPRRHLGADAPERADERARLLAALREGGHRGAARILGIGERTVARRMKRHGITGADYDRSTRAAT